MGGQMLAYATLGTIIPDDELTFFSVFFFQNIALHRFFFWGALVLSVFGVSDLVKAG
jgi:hypothetical protein